MKGLKAKKPDWAQRVGNKYCELFRCGAIHKSKGGTRYDDAVYMMEHSKDSVEEYLVFTSYLPSEGQTLNEWFLGNLGFITQERQDLETIVRRTIE